MTTYNELINSFIKSKRGISELIKIPQLKHLLGTSQVLKDYQEEKKKEKKYRITKEERRKRTKHKREVNKQRRKHERG